MPSFFFRCLIHHVLSYCVLSRVVGSSSLSKPRRGVLKSDSDNREQSAEDDDANLIPNIEPDHNDNNQKMMQRLVDAKLGASYNKDMRPIPDTSVFDGTHRIKIYLGLKLVKMLEIHQIQQTFRVAVWLRVMWPDYRLKYNAADYLDGSSLLINRSWDSDSMWIPIEQTKVWTPEIHALNSVAAPEMIWKGDALPRVLWYDENKLKESGYNMVLVTPEILTVTCSMQLKEFPFDTQNCNIQFGGWSAGERFFEIAAVQMEEVSSFRDDDTEFEITPLDPVAKSFHDHYLAGNQPVPTVEYPIRFNRKPHFYLLTMVLPMFLLVLFGQSLYWMDMQKERLSTGITVVLAVMAVNFLVEPLLPKTKEVLWIEKFQVGCYILTCLPLFFSILLDHCVLKKFCSEDQAQVVDSFARIVHPLVALTFYFANFGVPGFRTAFYGHIGEIQSFWPSDVPAIMGFLLFNVCIFCSFLGSACMEIPFFRKYLPKVPDADAKEEP